MRLRRPIPLDTQHLLTRIYRYSRHRRASQRAHCLLLRAQGKTMSELRSIILVSQKTVYNWLNGWDERGLLSLYDRPGRGRKPKLNDEQKAQVKAWVLASPQKLSSVIKKIKETWNIDVSLDTLRRVLKSLKMSWRRMRRVPGNAPSPDYERKRSALEILKTLDRLGEIDLFYCDETGFSLVPPVPYAWQEIAKTLEIPSQRSKRLNVLGFMNRQGDLESYHFDKSITGEVVVGCIEVVFPSVDKPTVIVIDQASIHTGHAVQDICDEWAQRGVYLFELPTYSPELNLIEIAWRFIKYQWLDSSAYESWETLVAEVEKILAGFGEEFVINFA